MGKPDKILAHELLGREVLNLQAGEVAGSVVDFGINRDGKVQLIGVLPSAWYSGGRGIAPSAITFLTGDRMCIANGEALQDFSPDGEALISTDSGGQIYGKTVLLHDGDMLGELVDFRFNLGDGRITDLLVLDGEQRRTRVPIEKISTIGKDYIIIERASGDGESAASDSAGEAAPFSGAAAAAEAPAAAEPVEPVAEIPEPAPARPAVQAAGRSSRNQRGKSRGGGAAVVAAVVDEDEAESVAAESSVSEALPLSGEGEPDASPLEATDAPEAPAAVLEDAPPVEPEDSAVAQAEADPQPARPVNNAASLDSVFSLPSSTPQQGDLLGGLTGTAPAAPAVVEDAPAEAPEPDLFAERGISVSKFDQKKLEFLRGKPAHRDIKDPDGIILVGEGETLDQQALVRIVEGGVLGEVFIEMTLKK